MRRCDVVILGFRPDAVQRCVEIVARMLGITLEEAATKASIVPFIACQDISLEEAEALEARLHEAGAVVECRLRRREPSAPKASSPLADRMPTVAELLGSDGTASGVQQRGAFFDRGTGLASAPPAVKEEAASELDMERYLSAAPRASASEPTPAFRESNTALRAPPPTTRSENTGPISKVGSAAQAPKPVEPATTARFDLWLVAAPPSIHDADRIVADVLGLDLVTATKAVFEAPSMLRANLSEADLQPLIGLLRASGLNVAGRPAVKQSGDKPRASLAAANPPAHTNKTAPRSGVAQVPPAAVARPAAEAAPAQRGSTSSHQIPKVAQAAAQPRTSGTAAQNATPARAATAETPKLKVRVAYSRIEGAEVAVFDAHPKNGTDKERAALLLELIAQARQAGMTVTKAALAYSDGSGSVRYFGTPDLVRYLVANGCGPWTHSLGFSRTG